VVTPEIDEITDLNQQIVARLTWKSEKKKRCVDGVMRCWRGIKANGKDVSSAFDLARVGRKLMRSAGVPSGRVVRAPGPRDWAREEARGG